MTTPDARYCSICAAPEGDCDHVRGLKYPVVDQHGRFLEVRQAEVVAEPPAVVSPRARMRRK